MALRTLASADASSSRFEVADDYFCPVCGVELSLSNFLTPAEEYYCPVCSTRQTPATV